MHYAIPLILAALLVLSRPHPILTLVPGYVLKEFGTS